MSADINVCSLNSCTSILIRENYANETGKRENNTPNLDIYKQAHYIFHQGSSTIYDDKEDLKQG